MAILDRLKAMFRQSAAPRRLELETVALAAASEEPKTTGLTDAEGRPVDRSVLDQEQAGPVMGGVRSILYNAVTGTLDPWKLQRILNNALQGQADEYLQLAEEMEEKYPQYRGCLRTRKQAVTGLDITVEAASDDQRHQDDAQLIRDFLSRDTVDGETFDILDAMGKAYSVTELLWDKSKTPWLPRLKTRDPRWFEFDLVDGETLRLKGGPDGTAAMPTDLEPYKYIIHRSSDKTGLTIRGGLARAACWSYLFNSMTLKDWVICAEIYGMPIRVGKYDRNATLDDRNKLLRAVMNIASDAAAIIPDSMSVEFQDAMSGATPAMYKELCEYLDQSISKLVLGQTATTDATAGGLGGSQGNVHNDVREDVRDADAKGLASTLNRDLVRPIIDLNHGTPPGNFYPRIKIGQAETFSPEDMDKLERFVMMGGRVEESVIRDKLGYSDPPETTSDGKPVMLLKPPTGSTNVPSTETPPQAANDPSRGAKIAASASLASERALAGPYGALKAPGNPVLVASDDAIDEAVAEMRDQWQPVMAPVIDPIQAAFEAATSFDDLKARLLALPQAIQSDAFAEALARSLFMARLAGEAGQAVTGGGDAPA